jgi:HK97 family phage portal protein
MAFFKRNKQENKKIQQTTKKNWSLNGCSNGFSFYDHLIGENQSDLSFWMLYRYYQKASPVADSIDRIAKEFSAIEPQIYDKENNEFINTNFLGVIENPNLMMTKHQFLFNLAATYLITGNVLLYGTGISKLQELNYVEPNYLTLQSDNLNILQSITVNKQTYNQTYKLQELNDTEFYVAQNQIARFIRNYSPYFSYSNQWGISRLCAISFEIEQFMFSSVHNLALLGNTVKPSGIVEMPGVLSPDQEDRLEAQIRSFYSGASNTAKVLLLDNGMEFKPINNRLDSDFQTLRQNVETSIYRRLEIPMALVSNQAMTFNNLEVANLMLYDNAVLPLTKILYKQLQDIIFYYNKINPERYCITYDPNSIEALAIRKSQLVKDKVESGSYTYNEIRQMYGDERLSEGGDTIYIQSTLIPAAENDYIEPTNNGT